MKFLIQVRYDKVIVIFNSFLFSYHHETLEFLGNQGFTCADSRECKKCHAGRAARGGHPLPRRLSAARPRSDCAPAAIRLSPPADPHPDSPARGVGRATLGS